LLLRTSHHPSAEWLASESIPFETCDDLYESAEDFRALYAAIAERARTGFDVYAVPGHPLIGETSVQLLMEEGEAEVFGAPSFVDMVLEASGCSIDSSLQVWNAYEPARQMLDPRCGQIVYNFDSPDVASDAKMGLLRWFTDSHECLIVDGWGSGKERRLPVPLSEIDRHGMNSLTSVWVPPLVLDRAPGFYGLVQIVDALLGPGGCPWDREQTHETLKKHLIEEAYETIEAIDSKDPDRLSEELGDLILQPIMHAQMDAIEGLYSIDDVVGGISEKLVRRHPHVFGDQNAATADEVLENWDAIKQAERSEPRSVLSGVPGSLPALLRAHEVGERAARVGFDWQDEAGVRKKVDEEFRELDDALASGDSHRIEEEIGDLLFSLANLARWRKVNPEEALRKMLVRFTERFAAMESASPKPLRELSLDEWDALWESAKRSAAGSA
jgi:tetrapyrrole methylase family protein/MazG family protein